MCPRSYILHCVCCGVEGIQVTVQGALRENENVSVGNERPGKEKRHWLEIETN